MALWVGGAPIAQPQLWPCGSGRLRQEAVSAFLLIRWNLGLPAWTQVPFPRGFQTGSVFVCSQVRGALPSPSFLCSLGEGGSPRVGSAWRLVDVEGWF